MTQVQGATENLSSVTSITPHAFKDWALVCNSMLEGATSLIFRKGGIAEGRDGFRFRHESFFLFPTFFHEQVERLRLDPRTTVGSENSDSVALAGYAQVEFTAWISDLAILEPLSDLHILKPEVLEQRYAYDEPKGLHLAMVRVFRISPVWVLPYQKSFGGCRSWIELPPPPHLDLTPVLGENEHNLRRERVRAAAAEK
ncbi:MAG: DUF1802 family protein [Verrucomicrobia bacterium]|nr:DUF1802 family protein [Verrucomicrobiota bacterium]